MFPKLYYNELSQIGVDFESQVEVEAYDRKQSSNSAAESRELIATETPLRELGSVQ